jgi:hypothetical protein
MPVAGCGAEEGENLGQESARARALPARVPPKLQGRPVRGCPTSVATGIPGTPAQTWPPPGAAQVDQQVAEAALAARPQLDFGTRHGIDRLCCPCRWIQVQRPPRRTARHDGLPEDPLRHGRNRHHRRKRTISAVLRASPFSRHGSRCHTEGSLCALLVVWVAAADPVQMYLAGQCGMSPQVTLSGRLQDDHVAAGVVDDGLGGRAALGWSVEPHACGAQPLVVVSRSSKHRTSPCSEPGHGDPAHRGD